MKNCAVCRGGQLKPGTINHIVEQDGRIVIIKNVPAMVCSQCGEGYIDHAQAVKLEEMVAKAKLQGMEVVIIDYARAAA